MKLTPEKNNHKKSISVLMRNSKINSEQKTTSFSTASANINSKNLSNIIQKKIETPLDFIKQKKKFNIKNLFDVNGAKNFLASKDEALMEIKLEDEILSEKNKKNSKLLNTNLSSIDCKNKKDFGKKNKNKKKTVTFSSIEDRKKNTEITKLNSKKYKESKYKNKKRTNSVGNFKINEKNSSNNSNSNKNNNILIIDELNNYPKESNFFYKFILDNANDSDDVFQKKLETVIKSIENKKKEKEKEKSNLLKIKKKNTEILRSHSSKNPKKTNNIFIYSEKVKKLMANDTMEISSIGSSEKNSPKNFSMKNNIKIEKNIFFGQKEREFINDTKKDSLVSVLNEFYKS